MSDVTVTRQEKFLPVPPLPDRPADEWYYDAACRETPDPDIFFSSSVSAETLSICGGCPVRGDCLKDTLLLESELPLSIRRQGMVAGISVKRRTELAEELGLYAPEEEVTHKVCLACGVEKPRDDFHRRAVSSDGLQKYCIPCRREGRSC